MKGLIDQLLSWTIIFGMYSFENLEVQNLKITKFDISISIKKKKCFAYKGMVSLSRLDVAS